MWIIKQQSFTFVAQWDASIICWYLPPSQRHAWASIHIDYLQFQFNTADVMSTSHCILSCQGKKWGQLSISCHQPGFLHLSLSYHDSDDPDDQLIRVLMVCGILPKYEMSKGQHDSTFATLMAKGTWFDKRWHII